MANLIFSPIGYTIGGILSATVLLFCGFRYGVPTVRPKGWKLIAGIILSVLILLIRAEYFNGKMSTCYLLSAGAFYSVFSMVSLVLGQPRFQEKHIRLVKTTSSFAVYGVLLLVAFAFVSLYGEKHLLTLRIPDGDYSIFYYIAKMWREGMIPYLDTFDHKGPLIFFVFLLGQILHADHGIFFLYVLCLWITLCFAYRIPQTGSRPRAWGSAAVACVLLFLYKLDYGLLLCEPVTLPFLMAAAYVANRYFTGFESQPNHPTGYAFVYGLAISAAFLVRLTDAIAIMVYVACILVMLMAKGLWKNILQNIAGFLLGFSALFLPFAVYFAAHGALDDMLWASILFNALYSGGTEPYNLFQVYKLFCSVWPFCGIFLLSALTWKHQAKALLIPNLLAVLAATYMVSSGYRFSHYFITLAIFVPVGLLLLRGLDFSQDTTRRIPLVVVILCMLISSCARFRVIDHQLREPVPTAYETASMEIAGQIPEEDRDAVIGYNTRSLFFLYTDITPCYKYYTLQDWQSMKSAQMQEENAAFYRSGQAKWVVVESDVLSEPVRQAIEENYTLCYESYFGEDASEVLLLYGLAN